MQGAMLVLQGSLLHWCPDSSRKSKETFAVVLLERLLARGTAITHKDTAGFLSTSCLLQYCSAACSAYKMFTTCPPGNFFSFALERWQVQTLSPRPHGCEKSTTRIRWRAQEVRRKRANITAVLLHRTAPFWRGATSDRNCHTAVRRASPPPKT